MTLEVDGIEEYRTQLSVLDAKKQRRFWRSVFRAAGQKTVQKRARANLRRLGHRKMAGKVTTRARATNLNVEARIGARKRTRLAWIGHLIENPTRPHVIKSRNKGVLARGREVFGSSVRHPGTAARPWLKPALSDSSQQATDFIMQQAAKEMEKFKRRA